MKYWVLVLTLLNPDVPLDDPNRYFERVWFVPSEKACYEALFEVEKMAQHFIASEPERFGKFGYTVKCEERAVSKKEGDL